jgi:integrase
MRGHIRKRGATWTAVAYLGRDPETAKPKYKWSGGHRTRKDAERALTELVGRVQKGTYLEPTKQTVGEYLTAWLTAASLDLRPSTRPAYEIAVEKHLVPRLGALPLQKLTTTHLNVVYADLLASGRRDGKGGLSPRSVRFIHTIIRKALNDAVDARLLDWNPASKAKPPKAKTADEQARRKRSFWDAEEVRRFLDAAKAHRLHAAFHLAAMTGMRRGEVLGLRWRDLDLEGARLVVEQTLVAPRYVLTFSEPKTQQGRRSIDLDPETLAVLRAHRVRQAQEQLAFGPDYAASELVFRSSDGTPVIPALFSLAFKKVVKDAGLATIRLHDLRHTHVALLARAGVPAKVIQERVGHHSAGFTLDNYGGTFPSQHRDAADRFAALVGASVATGGPPATHE